MCADAGGPSCVCPGIRGCNLGNRYVPRQALVLIFALTPRVSRSQQAREALRKAALPRKVSMGTSIVLPTLGDPVISFPLEP